MASLVVSLSLVWSRPEHSLGLSGDRRYTLFNQSDHICACKPTKNVFEERLIENEKQTNFLMYHVVHRGHYTMFLTFNITGYSHVPAKGKQFA